MGHDDAVILRALAQCPEDVGFLVPIEERKDVGAMQTIGVVAPCEEAYDPILVGSVRHITYAFIYVP
jgi:hypothetical protein